MSVRKLSVALQEDTAEGAAAAAAEEGLSLSAWLNDAAETKLTTRAGLEAVHEWEAEYGSPTAADLAEADRILDEAGVGRPAKDRSR